MDSNTSQPRTSRIGGLEQLGKYELVCVLARSDLGSLWASVITYGDGVGQLMAVQRIVVRPGDEETLTDPIREAVEALKGLRRPGVIPVVDCVVSPGRLGVVSEYVEGEPLRSLQNLASLKKSPIEAGIAVRLGLDILEALVEFHGLAAENEALSKYVYGGLSPDTVVVTAKGKAQLLNPGLAAVATSLPALSWHTAALAYRAPEHLGSGTQVDARTDVFVAGVMLWELIAQRQLFQTRPPGATPSEPPRSSKRNDQVVMAQQVLTASIDRLDKLELATPVSKQLADVIDKALQRDPAARFGSAREMAEALALATQDMTAPTTKVAEMIEGLASSTLTTRRSAIARAGVDVSPDSRPARVASSDDEDVFGSDWVTDADAGVDDKIHALSAGALAMTPTPSAAIAVGPKPSVAVKAATGAPRPPSVLRTPAPGIVRPAAKPEAPGSKLRPLGAKPATPATKPAEPAKPADRKATPSPAAAAPVAEDDFGIDVELPDDNEPESVAPESAKKPTNAPQGKRPPPPRVAAKAKTPAPAEVSAAAAAPKADSADSAGASVDVPPPPQELVESGNAFMSGIGGDAFAGGGEDAFASAEPATPAASSDEAAPAAAEGLWKAPGATAGESAQPAEAVSATVTEQGATRSAEHEEPSPVSAQSEAGSVSDPEFDDRLAMAARRRRKGYMLLAVVGGLAVLVGLIAVVHMATRESPSENLAATTTTPPPSTPAQTATATDTAPAATTTTEPAATPSQSAEPAPTESVAAASAEPPPAPSPPAKTAAAPATAKPPPRTGTGKPKPPKPYTPSGI